MLRHCKQLVHRNRVSNLRRSVLKHTEVSLRRQAIALVIIIIILKPIATILQTNINIVMNIFHRKSQNPYLSTSPGRTSNLPFLN